MMALLYATYVIRGLWEYEDVPAFFLDDVDKILIAEGRKDLIQNAE